VVPEPIDISGPLDHQLVPEPVYKPDAAAFLFTDAESVTMGETASGWASASGSIKGCCRSG
jgi:hypothetical protein